MAESDAETIQREWFEDPTFSYLKRHYFDAAKLEQRTMVEFARALRTGRVIAFTGSLTTIDRGYPKWRDFAAHCFDFAFGDLDKFEEANARADVLTKNKEILATFKETLKREDFDVRVAFSVIGEIMDIVGRYSSRALSNLNEKIANEIFLKRERPVKPNSVLDCLLTKLDIDRILTLNYDFEVELAIAQDRGAKGSTVAKLNHAGIRQDDPATHKIVLRMPGGRSLVSDVFLRERTDRLIEFAVGSAEHEYHVMHLHGRADRHETMVVSYRDYDRLYRRSGTSKVPFEHALGLLYSGNPVLFVGIGMSESEINQSLQDVVGDHPYRRVMPTFLLWNADMTLSEEARKADKAIKRIDMLHRLGVLTLFDDDLARHAGVDLLEGETTERLARSIDNLAAAMARRGDEHAKPISHWRSLSLRVPQHADGKIIAAWALIAAPSLPAPAALITPFREENALLTVVAATSGLRKGAAARCFANRFQEDHPLATVVHINADFCFDTDTMLNLIAEVLWRRRGQRGPRHMSRSRQFAEDLAFCLPDNSDLVVVISGTERMFGNGGEPLSAEFDEAMRCFAASCCRHARSRHAHARFVILGTLRVKQYFCGLFGEVGTIASDGRPPVVIIDYGPLVASSGQSNAGDAARRFRKHHYLEVEMGVRATEAMTPIAIRRVDLKAGPDVAIADYRRAHFAANLTPTALRSLGLDPDLALDILMVMAFVGQPVEAEVLLHVPRLRTRLADPIFGVTKEVERLERIGKELRLLSGCGLVLPVAPSIDPTHMPRFGIHATLLAELRDRSGVPLSEAALSAAFNMSLYAAQPTDGPVPEPHLHDELGHMIDWLIGAYNDPSPISDERPSEPEHHRPDALAALRAALAVIRGFYSTSALLSIESDRSTWLGERDGALTEHGERLDRLLEAFLRSQRAVERRGDTTGFGAFYPDEIVWLYNERGVVKLAQGDLYEARAAFDEADRFNRTYVEFGDRALNWRRITLNQIVVDIERGRFSSARDRIDMIEREISPKKWERAQSLADQARPGSVQADPVISYEEMLTLGLTTGYRGLCDLFRGDMLGARRGFEQAMALLHRLGELRALAIFQRYYASLGQAILEGGVADDMLERAICSAQAAHQMDVVHQGRIRRADRRISPGRLDELARSNRDLIDALRYADSTDTYRVRVEARRGLARLRIASGDYEVALEHAIDAMTTATRYGLSLRKIDLRILIGEILILRGDPLSGRALIHAAIEAATRIGYQRALAHAHTALGG